MPLPLFQLPELNDWLANAAGILPLSTLIDFINVATSLHTYELVGISHSLWQWPITPSGAQLLMSRADDLFGGCTLDRAEVTPALQCIDTRWADLYPCASPFTMRLCTQSSKKRGTIKSDEIKKAKFDAERSGRPIMLDLVIVSHFGHCAPVRGSAEEGRQSFYENWLPRSLDPDAHGKNNIRRLAASYLGWALWIGCMVLAIVGNLQWYISAAYLATILVTGSIVRYTHGHDHRKLLNVNKDLTTAFQRLVVAADNMNAMQWTAYLGGSEVVNALMNKPLYRTNEAPKHYNLLRWVLGISITAQWVFVVLASAQQNWNAFIIAFWIIFCAVTSAVIYTPSDAVQDWLAMNHVEFEKVRIEVSNRRVMLSILVGMNNDRKDEKMIVGKDASKGRNTRWIDPILKSSADREMWEEALYAALDIAAEHPKWEPGRVVDEVLECALRDKRDEELEIATRERRDKYASQMPQLREYFANEYKKRGGSRAPTPVEATLTPTQRPTTASTMRPSLPYWGDFIVEALTVLEDIHKLQNELKEKRDAKIKKMLEKKRKMGAENPSEVEGGRGVSAAAAAYGVKDSIVPKTLITQASD
ncbi:hypothetical protein DFH27DRAFT_657290 [Peziza echinospora]|nr:hypothetical protein DFH27DRAFT_657290 [Peziza echinospora]